MIVRVASKGQFRLDDDGIQQLNEFDNEAVAAVDRGDARDQDGAGPRRDPESRRGPGEVLRG